MRQKIASKAIIKYDDKVARKAMSDIQQKGITQSTQQVLGMLPASFAPGRSVAGMDKVDDKKATHESLIDYAGGGSRDNPGQSAAGFVLIDTAVLSFTRKGA